MSDDRLRELERRYRASGNAEDWAAWALARRRAGELGADADPYIERIAAGQLTREQVALAGYLGDPAALALDEHEVLRVASYMSDELEIVPVVLGDPERGDLEAWVRGLAHWSPRWCVLALLAVAEQLRTEIGVGMSEEALEYDLDYFERLADRALGAARDCLADPRSDAKRAVALEHAALWGGGNIPAVRAAMAAARAAAAASGASQADSEEARGVELVLQAPEVVEWIRAALLPQVLGAPV
ncbi:MAG TPA: hypothetical protein DEA08_23995 [Planctomycetes bacterium]|nr:hypothetical protein [Planctomycetota bacterium]